MSETKETLSTALTLRIPKYLLDEIDEMCRTREIPASRTALIRAAVRFWLDAKKEGQGRP